jgi:hypothetical protein
VLQVVVRLANLRPGDNTSLHVADAGSLVVTFKNDDVCVRPWLIVDPDGLCSFNGDVLRPFNAWCPVWDLDEELAGDDEVVFEGSCCILMFYQGPFRRKGCTVPLVSF